MSEELADDWKYYADKFSIDLGLNIGNQAGEYWGYDNYDANRVSEFARYFISHPEYHWVAREALCSCVLVSADHRLETGTLNEDEETHLLAVVKLAMSDPYLRDVVRYHWHEPSHFPLARWLRANFPDWEPPRSIWSQLSD